MDGILILNSMAEFIRKYIKRFMRLVGAAFHLYGTDFTVLSQEKIYFVKMI